MPDSPPKPHRKTVIGSGLLCFALALVVLFTGPGAFRSPEAVVVVAAIGAAAVLFQLRIRNASRASGLRPPMFLNMLGILFALAALFPGALGLPPKLAQTMALGSVCSFAISSALILHSFRKHSPKPE